MNINKSFLFSLLFLLIFNSYADEFPPCNCEAGTYHHEHVDNGAKYCVLVFECSEEVACIPNYVHVITHGVSFHLGNGQVYTAPEITRETVFQSGKLVFVRELCYQSQSSVGYH